MKRIVVEVVADDIEKANAILRNTVDMHLVGKSFCPSDGNGSASVMVTDADVKYGCHVDLEPGQEPDECVKDDSAKGYTCIYAKGLKRKEDCKYWRPVK